VSCLKDIAHLCWTSSVHTPKLIYILAVYNVDVPNVDVYNVDVPNVDVPNVDVPNVDVPNVDVPNVDVPNVDVPNFMGLSIKVSLFACFAILKHVCVHNARIIVPSNRSVI